MGAPGDEHQSPRQGSRQRRESHWLTAIMVTGGGCWQWTGARHELGYGRVRISGKVVPSHRHIYTLIRGPIPEGMQLDHLCRNPPCCNPWHLEPVAPEENVHRGAMAIGFGHPANRMWCKRGHEFTEQNTYLNPKNGAKSCKICRKAAFKAFHERKAS